MLEKKTGRETVGGAWEARFFVIEHPVRVPFVSACTSWRPRFPTRTTSKHIHLTSCTPQGVLLHYKKPDKAGFVLGSMDLAGLVAVVHPPGKDGVVDTLRLNVETVRGTCAHVCIRLALLHQYACLFVCMDGNHRAYAISKLSSTQSNKQRQAP